MRQPISLAHHIAAAANRQPAALALRTDEQSWSYRELHDRVSGLAGAIASQAASPALAFAGNSLQLALGACACSAAGQAFWPLDPASLAARWPAWAALGGDAVVRLESLPADAIAIPLADVPPNSPTLIIGTSGSEGVPKAVMLSHANLDAAARASNRRLPLGPGDCWLDCLPLCHIGGMSILWRCFQAGANVLLHEGFDAEAVRRALDEEPVTHVSLVPAMLAALLAVDPRPPPHLRVALVGGAALSLPLQRRAKAAGWPIFPTYGMSETAAQVATHLPDGTAWHEGDVGMPLAGNEISLGPDSRLRIRGPQVMLGYLNPALQPGLGLEDGCLVSGDLGRFDARGALTILGRADDMLISGGNNIHPAEVEAGLADCPGLLDIAVTGLPDPVWGDTVIALVVGPVSDATLQAWSRDRLPAAARPRHIVRVGHLPRNALGKLERQTLRIMAAGSQP